MLSVANRDIITIENGSFVQRYVYDAWGEPLSATYTDINFSGLEAMLSYTGYSWDVTLKLYYAQARMYDASARRFTTEDPARDGTNWYAYCEGNPLIRVDVYGLDSYVFYDPFAFGWDASVTALLHKYELENFFGTPAYIIAMSSVEELEEAWNKMGNYGTEKIDAVVFITHSNAHSLRIYTDPDGKSSKNISIRSDFFDKVNKQEIGYFILLGCNMGKKENDVDNPNYAIDMVKSKHIIDVLVASDKNTWSRKGSTWHASSAATAKGELPATLTGKGFKTYKWNYDTNSVDITPIGNEFDTFTDMLDAISKNIPAPTIKIPKIPTSDKKKK